MVAQKGDVRAVNSAAHVEAARHGHPHLGGKRHALEILKEFIHHRLDHGGSIGCRSVAVDVSLGVNDVGHAGACSADGEFVTSGNVFPAIQVLFQGLNFVQAVHHELNVVACGETEIAVAVLVCNVADLTHILDRHEPGTAGSDCENLVPAFCDMNQDAGLQDLMVFPFPVVLLNEGGKYCQKCLRGPRSVSLFSMGF